MIEEGKLPTASTKITSVENNEYRQFSSAISENVSSSSIETIQQLGKAEEHISILSSGSIAEQKEEQRIAQEAPTGAGATQSAGQGAPPAEERARVVAP